MLGGPESGCTEQEFLLFAFNVEPNDMMVGDWDSYRLALSTNFECFSVDAIFRRKNSDCKMSSRSNRTLSPEVAKGNETEKTKKVGRFAVSPPLSLEAALPRRSARLSRGATDSARISKLIMEVCQDRIHARSSLVELR